jgi:protein SCO1
MSARLSSLAFSLLVVWAGACQRRTGPQFFTARGVVEQLSENQQRIKINHEDIPGFMQAMTMEFEVKDKTILAGVQPGEEINFTIERTPESFYVVKITREGESQTIESPPLEDGSTVAEEPGVPAEESKVEFAPFPATDFTLTDQDGRPFTLSSLGGKVVVMDFIFTDCPGPCPILSLKFSRLQERLGERLGKEVMLLSVTIDPRRDTPEVLKAYAQRYQANLDGWKFLTGSTRNILLVAAAYGADYQAGSEEVIDHRLLTCVIDRNGVVVREFSGANHTVEDLLGEVQKLLS